MLGFRLLLGSAAPSAERLRRDCLLDDLWADLCDAHRLEEAAEGVVVRPDEPHTRVRVGSLALFPILPIPERLLPCKAAHGGQPLGEDAAAPRTRANGVRSCEVPGRLASGNRRRESEGEKRHGASVKHDIEVEEEERTVAREAP